MIFETVCPGAVDIGYGGSDSRSHCTGIVADQVYKKTVLLATWTWWLVDTWMLVCQSLAHVHRCRTKCTVRLQRIAAAHRHDLFLLDEAITGERVHC